MRNHEKILIIAIVLMTIFMFGCTSQAQTGSQPTGLSSQERKINVEKVEIYHFHGTHQCYSCITVGAYAEEAVNTYFADEVKSGKIVFGHINGELPENQELVMKYGATGSSLWIGVYNASGFYPEQNINVWYKINNKEDYMTYLKGVIEQKLAGK